MGITGDWDQRITRRTLLQHRRLVRAPASPLVGALGERGRSRRPPFAERPVHARRRLGRPDAARRRPVDAARARAARGRRRPARTRPTACATRSRADEDFRHIVRRGDDRARVPDEAHSVHVEVDGLDAGARVLLPLQGRRRGQPASAARAPRPPATRMRRRARVRVRVVPELRRRLLHAVRRGREPRRTSRPSIYLGDYIYEGPAHDRPRARAGARDLHARRLPDPPRPVQDRRPTCRRRTPRTRGSSPGTTTRSRTTTRTWTSDPDVPVEVVAARAAPPPTGPTGSTCRSRRARKPRRARPAALPALPLGRRSPPSTCSTGASTAPTSRPPARRQRDAERLLPRRPRARAHHARRRAARLAARGARDHDGALERPRRSRRRSRRSTADSAPPRGFGAGDNWDGYVAERQHAARLDGRDSARRTRS